MVSIDVKIFKNKRNNQIILIPKRKKLSKKTLKILEKNKKIKLEVKKKWLKD